MVLLGEDLAQDAQLLSKIEKARLATWFNVKPASPSLTMLSLLAETDLAQKKLQTGPFGTDSVFTVPNLNVFIQIAKQQLRHIGEEPHIL